MEIKLNKEIRDFTESIFFGLSLRQFLFSLLAAGLAVAVYFGLREVVGLEIVSWLCILCAVPCAALGFIKFNGMPFEQLAVVIFRAELLMPQHLTYRAKNTYREWTTETRKRSKYEADNTDKAE